MREIVAGEPDAAKRRLVFFLVGLDGVTPATGEAGGQPTVEGGAGIGTLVKDDSVEGDNTYYALLDPATVATAAPPRETRYQSGTAALVPGDTFVVVAPRSPLQPAEEGRHVKLYKGTDGYHADGQDLSWSSSSLPYDLTGASVLFKPLGKAGFAGSLVATGGSPQTVRAEPTAAYKEDLPEGRTRYSVIVTLASGHVYAPFAGTLDVVRT